MNAEIPDPPGDERRVERQPRVSLPDPLIGKTLGRYHLLGALGRGGASVVYLAQLAPTPANATPAAIPDAPVSPAAPADGAVGDAQVERVAVKVLIIPADLPEEEQYGLRMRFVRETRILERLRHSHILPVIESNQAAGHAFLAMPYLAGGTLAKRLAVRHGPLPLAESVTFISQLASALDAAHTFGVVHRDVKPSNILLDADGQRAYLTDFGIASLSGELARLFGPATEPITLTMAGTTIGTPSYMAPEQIKGERLGPATDIYALGVVAYQLVTGQTPFQGETPLQIAVRQVSDPPRPPSLLCAELPAPAEAAILRALATRPADRFTTAGAFAEAFAAGLRGEWGPGLGEPPAPRRRQRLRLPWRPRQTPPLPTYSPVNTPTDAAPDTTPDTVAPAPTDAPHSGGDGPHTPMMRETLTAPLVSTAATAAAPHTPSLPLLALWRSIGRVGRIGARMRRSLASGLLALRATAL